MDSIVSATLNPYVSNVIKDHKTINKGSFIIAHLIVQSRAIFHWLNEIGHIYLWITMQIQFILPALIVDLIIRFFTTERYLKSQQNINLYYKKLIKFYPLHIKHSFSSFSSLSFFFGSIVNCCA